VAPPFESGTGEISPPSFRGETITPLREWDCSLPVSRDGGESAGCFFFPLVQDRGWALPSYVPWVTLYCTVPHSSGTPLPPLPSLRDGLHLYFPHSPPARRSNSDRSPFLFFFFSPTPMSSSPFPPGFLTNFRDLFLSSVVVLSALPLAGNVFFFPPPHRCDCSSPPFFSQRRGRLGVCLVAVESLFCPGRAGKYSFSP